jgi:branched-chain amino acid transport system ATP-binding protein
MFEIALQAVGIVKRFGGLAALDGVDFELRRGELHAVIGPNGAGKSTFLATLAGDLIPTAGRVIADGEDISDLSLAARVRRGIGRTYQHSAIISGFTALDMARLAAIRNNSSVGRLLLPLSSDARATSAASVALQRVGLSGRDEIATEALSHGEKRRLEIAAVLALSPRMLLLDEPLAGLGSDESRGVVDLVSELKQTCSIVLIEHDIDVVFAIADRITVLDNGRVIATGLPKDVRDDPAVQSAYLGVDDE